MGSESMPKSRGTACGQGSGILAFCSTVARFLCQTILRATGPSYKTGPFHKERRHIDGASNPRFPILCMFKARDLVQSTNMNTSFQQSSMRPVPNTDRAALTRLVPMCRHHDKYSPEYNDRHSIYPVPIIAFARGRRLVGHPGCTAV